MDANDPQFNTAYTAALRSTLDSLEEFRVTTSNYGADSGRSSSAQVSLVTKSGTNCSTARVTPPSATPSTSSNEYFNKLAGHEVPKLDKQIYGGSLGGPIIKDKLFFFCNYERLKEDSEATAERSVPSETMRDGVHGLPVRGTRRQCPGGTVHGFQRESRDSCRILRRDTDGAGVARSARHRAERRGAQYLSVYPLPNDPGRDGHNIMTYRFTRALRQHVQHDDRADGLPPQLEQQLLRPVQRAARPVAERAAVPGMGLPPNTAQKVKSWGHGHRVGQRASSQVVNTFRYGFTKIVSDTVGTLNAPLNYFRFIDDLNEGSRPSDRGRETPTHNFVDDLTWIKGSHTMKFGTNLRFTPHPDLQQRRSYSYATANGSWVNGVGRMLHPRPRAAARRRAARLAAADSSFNASFADSWIDILGIMSQATGQYQLRSGRQLCCPRGIRCGGATRPTSTSSTPRTAGVSVTS